MPGVAQGNSQPVYITDQLGNALLRVQGPNDNYGLPTVLAGIQDIVVDDLATQIGLKVAQASGLPAGGSTVASVEITRPGDTNAYTAKDVYDASTSAPTGFMFQNVVTKPGGSGVIVKALLATDQKTNTARWRLHLFNTAPTLIVDNGPYLATYASLGVYQGKIDFDAALTEDATNSTMAYSLVAGYLLPVACAPSATGLVGILEILDGFTPASSQKVTIKLQTAVN